MRTVAPSVLPPPRRGGGGLIGRCRLRGKNYLPSTMSIPVEDLDDSCEVEQGSTEAVDLVHHDAVHRPSLDRCQEPLQSRAIHIAAGVPAIVKMVGDHLPALVLLAGNELATINA